MPFLIYRIPFGGMLVLLPRLPCLSLFPSLIRIFNTSPHVWLLYLEAACLISLCRMIYGVNYVISCLQVSYLTEALCMSFPFVG